MDDKLRLLIEQHGRYITRKEIIGNRYLYYRLLEAERLPYQPLLIRSVQERLLYRLA